ncbi:hypothetical protein ASD76_00095 [Altererythrobacter sp. Root672]|nr:hypothetical protein ASD76_00095 [Altererythrobacter sp. Root672]
MLFLPFFLIQSRYLGNEVSLHLLETVVATFLDGGFGDFEFDDLFESYKCSNGAMRVNFDRWCHNVGWKRLIAGKSGIGQLIIPPLLEGGQNLVMRKSRRQCLYYLICHAAS